MSCVPWSWPGWWYSTRPWCEPVIVAFAWIVVRWHAPILVEYPVLVTASFTATLVIYELAVRRYRVTRLLFGMKPASAPWTDDRFGQAHRKVTSGLPIKSVSP